MKKIALVSLGLWLFFFGIHSAPAAAAPFFGYYHVWDADLADVADHTNMLWIQTANPRQHAETMLREHPKAAFILEFQALDQAHVNGQKIHSFDAGRVAAILDVVEAWLPPHKGRLYAFSIVDEIETNPPSLNALQRLIDAIKGRPLLADVKLHVNFDNISEMYTRAQFVIPERLDLISITPVYGRLLNGLGGDEGRFRAVLNRAAEQNTKRLGNPLKFLVIGDGWAPQRADAVHEVKARLLYRTALREAREVGVEVVGQMVFSYSEPAGSVKDSPVMREVWRAIGKEFVAGRAPTPTPTPTPMPVPDFPWCRPR